MVPAITLNFTDGSILLNEDIIKLLEEPRQVQLLINTETKMLAIRACELDGESAVVIPPGPALKVEIGGRTILKKIQRITGWTDRQPRVCIGEFVPEHRAVVFSLEGAYGPTAQ